LLLIAASAAPADDPFVGKWKLDESRSKLSGQQMKIDALGGNKYKFTYGEISYTLVTDGTDQPIPLGWTRTITEEKPNTWRVVDKKDGRTLGTGTWTLSPDGRSMELDITGTNPDGSAFRNRITRKRTAGTSGFAGTWENANVKIGQGFSQLEVESFEGDGLTLSYPAMKSSLSMKFDGKDYEETGPDAPSGATSSGRRLNDRTLELTDKLQGKVVDTAVLKASPDGKTLTYTVHDKGQSKPIIWVYERQ
jgi:hypothetical protein